MDENEKREQDEINANVVVGSGEYALFMRPQVTRAEVATLMLQGWRYLGLSTVGEVVLICPCALC